MAFSTADIRLDFWRKTHTVSSGSRRSSLCRITRDAADMADPKGEKFEDSVVHHIPNFVRLRSAEVPGGVIVRRKRTRVVKPIS